MWKSCEHAEPLSNKNAIKYLELGMAATEGGTNFDIQTDD